MRRILSATVVLALVVSVPASVHARGEGWTDVMWGSIFGTAFGTVFGGASLVIYPSQAEADSHIYNVAIGAGAGLVGGAIYGAIIGWPKNAESDQVQLMLIPPIGEEGRATFVGFRKYF